MSLLLLTILLGILLSIVDPLLYCMVSYEFRITKKRCLIPGSGFVLFYMEKKK